MAALVRAISHGEIVPWYQPLVDLATSRLIGVEALARWDRDGVAVPPDVFIAAAERTGLIADLTALVLDLVCAQIAAWERELGRTELTVAVNVCSQQITDPAFPGQVRIVPPARRRMWNPAATSQALMVPSEVASAQPAAT